MITFRSHALRCGRLAVVSLFMLGTPIRPAGLYAHTQNIEGHPMGSVTIDIWDDTSYWVYKVDTETGEAQLVRTDRLRRRNSNLSLKPAGSIQNCDEAPTVESPNGSYVAGCRILRKKDHSPLRDDFFITHGSKLCFSWTPKEWRAVNGYTWSRDSRFVAVLNSSEHYSKSPLGILAGISGHPIPYGTVYLDVIDVHKGKVSEYRVRANVRYLSARILNSSF